MIAATRLMIPNGFICNETPIISAVYVSSVCRKCIKHNQCLESSFKKELIHVHIHLVEKEINPFLFIA